MQEEATSKRFYQLTGIEPEPFLTSDAVSDITETKCVLCHNMLAQGKPRYFCLIGRHKVLSQSGKWDWTHYRLLTKYGFQGAYVEICQKCYTKYSRRSSFASVFLAITVYPWLLLCFILMMLLPGPNYRILGFFGLLGFVIIVGVYVTTKSLCDSKHFSRKTVEINEVLPRYGVPNCSDSPYHEKELVSEEELLEVILDRAERDGDKE